MSAMKGATVSAPGKTKIFDDVLAFPQYRSPEDPLATREDGQKELACLGDALEGTRPGDVVGVDVSGVEFINYSFSDECFGNLAGRLQSGEHPERFVVIIAPKKDMENRLQDIEVALKNRKLAMLWAEDEGASEYDVVGELSEALRETLRAVEPGDTNDVLAEKLEIKSTACINRTDKLTKLRLLRKKLHSGEYGYKQYEFAPVLPASG